MGAQGLSGVYLTGPDTPTDAAGLIEALRERLGDDWDVEVFERGGYRHLYADIPVRNANEWITFDPDALRSFRRSCDAMPLEEARRLQVVESDPGDEG